MLITIIFTGNANSPVYFSSVVMPQTMLVFSFAISGPSACLQGVFVLAIRTPGVTEIVEARVILQFVSLFTVQVCQTSRILFGVIDEVRSTIPRGDQAERCQNEMGLQIHGYFSLGRIKVKEDCKNESFSFLQFWKLGERNSWECLQIRSLSLFSKPRGGSLNRLLCLSLSKLPLTKL